MPEKQFYFTGGTLPLHAASYIERAADAELVASLLRGEFCYVLNTRQMGKSSLMVRATQELRQASALVCVLDLTAIGQHLALDQWYFGMLRRMAVTLGLLSELSAFWRDHKELGPLQRWMEVLHEVLLPALAIREQVGEPSRLVVFIDEIDAVTSLAFSTDEFFGGIRACYNRRAEDPRYELLTFCLLGVASPADLISDVRLSPFNIGSRIRLTDFTASEAIPLANHLPALTGKGGSNTLLERVLFWTGGHPYMTQRLCLTLVQEAQKEEGQTGTLSRNQVDALCAKLFLTKAARDSDPNLAFVRSRLLRSDCDLAALLEMYQRIRAGKKVKDDETDPLCVTLRLSGVVREHNDSLAVRNRIYEHVFDPAWVQAHMPGAEQRRQKGAYRQGFLRAASVSLAILAVFAALVVTAKIQADRALIATDEAKQSLQRVTIKEAQVHQLNVALTQALTQKDLTNKRLMSALADVTRQSALAQQQTLLAQQQTRLAKNEEEQATTATVRAMTASSVAQEQKKIAVQRQSDLNAAVGARFIQEGDAVGALPSLTRALKLDRSVGDTTRETIQRVQIAGVLARAPRLDHIWFASEAVSSAVFSPDGSLIATEAAGGEVQVRDAHSGKSCWSVRRSSGGSTVAFSPDGRYLATTWMDGAVQVAEAGTGRLLIPSEQIVLKTSFAGRKFIPLWSPDSRRLAIYQGEQVAVWDLFPCKRRFTFRITGISINRAAFSPDGSYLALACWNWRALVLTADTGTLCSTIDRCWNAQNVEFTSDGKSLLTDGVDAQTYYDRVGLFDVRTGQPIRTFSTQHSYKYCLSHDGGQALVVEGLRARIYSTLNGEALSPFIALPSMVKQTQFSPDGSRVMFACLDGSVSIREVASGSLSDPIIHHAGEVVAALFDPSGQRLLTAGIDHSTRVWSLRPTGTPVWIYADSQERQTTPLLEGSRLLLWSDKRQEAVLIDAIHGVPLLQVSAAHVTRSEEERTLGFLWHDTFRVYDTRTGKPLAPARRLPPNALRTELCPDGRHYWVLTAERAIQSFVTATGVAVAPPAYPGRVTSCVTSGDGNLLLHLGQRSLQEWNPTTAKPQGALMTHAADVYRNWFLPKRHLMISRMRTSDTDAYLWDLRSGRLRARIKFGEGASCDLHLWAVRFTAFYPVDDVAAAAAITARGRQALGGPPTLPTKGASTIPTLIVDIQADGAAFSADRTRFVPVDQPGSPQHRQGVYKTTTGRLSVSLAQDQVFTSAQFSRDGGRVLTSTNDGLIRLWNAVTGCPVSPPLQIGTHWQKGNGLFGSEELSPDGKRVAALDSDGNLQVWDLALGYPLIPNVHTKTFWHCFTADSRYLIAGTNYGILRLDLTPDRRSEADLDRLNALLCGQQIDAGGNRMEVSLEEVRKAWETMGARRSLEFASPSPTSSDWNLDRQEQRGRSESLAGAGAWNTARQKRDRIRTALLVAQEDADSWFSLACDSAAHRQWPQTILACEALLRHASDDPNLWYLHGVACLYLGQEERASQDFAQMAAHSGSSEQTIDVSARVHREQGRWLLAAADYARLSADSSYTIRRSAARSETLLCLKAGDQAGYDIICARIGREILQIAKSDFIAEWLQIAALGPSDFKLQSALAITGEKAYAAQAGNADLRHATGCLLYRAGRDAEAIARLEMAVTDESGEQAIHSLLFLAMAHHRMHHVTQARAYFAEGRQRAESYLRSTRDIQDGADVWSPHMEMDLLLAEATTLLK